MKSGINGLPRSAEQSCPCLKNAGKCMLQMKATLDPLKQRRFCLSEDYDFCPTYLCYILTHTQSLRHDSDWLDAQR